MIILKSHLTLQVILPACARFVTFSRIDDSRSARAFSTTVPVSYITIAVSPVPLGRPYVSNTSLSFLYNQMLWGKFTNSSVASRSLVCSFSRIRSIVKISEVVEQFLWKVIWFFLRIFSISDWIRLRSRML